MSRMIKKVLAVCLAAALLFTAMPVSSLAAPKAKKLKLSKKKITMEVGDKLTIKSKGKAAVKAKITPKKAKLDIRVSSDDTDVVEVKKLNRYAYRLVAVEEGKAKITVTSLSNRKLKQRLTVIVEAAEEPQEPEKPVEFAMTARLTAEDKIAVAFTKEVPATVALSNFSLKDKTGNSVVALKNFVLGTDKKSAEIQALINFNIGNVYELSYNNVEDGKTYTVEINTKKGEVASLKLLTTTVPVNIAKEIKFAVYDTEGVDITASSKAYVTLKADIPAGKGFFNDMKNELTMFDNSATATITMTYQEGSKKVEGTGVVSVTNQSTETVSLETWSLYQAPAIPLDWTKPNNASSRTLGLNTSDLSLAVKVKTSDGKEFKSDTDPGFTFKSTDAAVFTMAVNTITPVAKGTAGIIVEFTYEGKTSKFTPITITVGENAKPQTIELNKNSVMLKKGNTDNLTKVVVVRDQYGNSLNYGAATWTFTANPAANAPTITIAADTITVDATGVGVDSGNYTIKAELTLAADKTHTMFAVIVTP